MADSTSAVLRWSARSETVGTPRGRFSVLPGLGIWTRRMSGARYPWRWMDWSIGSIHSSKLSFAASTVWPSTPAAEHFGICDRFFCTPVAREVMGQRGKAKIWLTPSFCCYLFKFRFHGQLIFSLNRRPCLPLNGAHVAQEQFNYR